MPPPIPTWPARSTGVSALLMIEEFKPARGDKTGDIENAPVVVRGAKLERLGDFRVLREAGRGGMGVVYEAEQESLGRRVALKVLAPHAIAGPSQVKRFEREARAAAQLHHTNIVPVFGVGEQDGLHYYAMQYISGLGLDTVIEEVKRFRPATPRPTLAKAPAPELERHPRQSPLPPGLPGRSSRNTLGQTSRSRISSPRPKPRDQARRKRRPFGQLNWWIRRPRLRRCSWTVETVVGFQFRCKLLAELARVGLQVATALEYATHRVSFTETSSPPIFCSTHSEPPGLLMSDWPKCWRVTT